MKRSCKHCGAGFPDGSGAGDFCCAGCRHVYALIRDEGLDTYYALQDRVGRPVGDLSLPQLGQLDDVVRRRGRVGCRAAQLAGDGYVLSGLCLAGGAACPPSAGCRVAQVSLQANTLTLKWGVGRFDLPALGRQLAGFVPFGGAVCGSAGLVAPGVADLDRLSIGAQCAGVDRDRWGVGGVGCCQRLACSCCCWRSQS